MATPGWMTGHEFPHFYKIWSIYILGLITASGNEVPSSQIAVLSLLLFTLFEPEAATVSLVLRLEKDGFIQLNCEKNLFLLRVMY